MIQRVLILLTLSLTAAPAAGAASRIKDIVAIEGVRDNPLVGLGIVVGLDGTGDNLDTAPNTQQILEALLQRLGTNTRGLGIDSQNVAAVTVTARQPPFAAAGTPIDVTVSAINDAQSLRGGTLLVTPLRSSDEEVYAVAQGAVTIGGFEGQGNAASITRGVPTVGRIANGAIVEREIPFDFNSLNVIRLSLRNPDFLTARRIADALNAFLGVQAAQATSPSIVSLVRPASFAGDNVALIAEIEQITVEPDQPARVIVDEANGVIVMGDAVRVSTVAIAQGNLTIAIEEAPQISQPAPFSDGVTAEVPRTAIGVEEQRGTGLQVVEGGVALRDLVNGLNALGVNPRDMITILQSLKAAGALQAEIEVI
ncbi:MAG: flagellar basal body P-ring protein FlgI [Maricaulaceae bacterium]